MLRLARIVLASSSIVVLGAACGGDDEDASTPTADQSASSSTPAVDGAAVSIDGNAYDPEALTIAPGTEVRWVNADGATHTVTADDETFASEQLAEGDEFAFTFDEAGEFTYTCEIHPFMEATITVE